VVILVAGMTAVWLASVGAVAAFGRLDDSGPADAIVVLGAAQWAGRPSPVLRARLDHASALWRARRAPLVVVTGGVGDGDTISEADVGRRYLIAHGLPDSAILVEREGRTTGESVASAAAMLRARGANRAILVSDPFHSLRLRILGARAGIRARTSPTRTSPISRNALTEWRYIVSESLKLPIAAIAPGL
jgi:uncharacterized SAM-binding protein YcdF (DUF218 family)